MSTWTSDLGPLSGLAEDAFTRTFKTIPDNTMATAKIAKFQQKEHKGSKHYEVDWEITGGEFKGSHVFQKIHAFDADQKKKHRSLNMLKYIFTLFNATPKSMNLPDDTELRQFIGKYAGLKIQEWSMPKEDGSGLMEGNFISEVHPVEGFTCVTGVKMEVTHSRETAFSRNQKQDLLDSDLPF